MFLLLQLMSVFLLFIGMLSQCHLMLCTNKIDYYESSLTERQQACVAFEDSDRERKIPEICWLMVSFLCSEWVASNRNVMLWSMHAVCNL